MRRAFLWLLVICNASCGSGSTPAPSSAPPTLTTGTGAVPRAALESALDQDYQQLFRTQIVHPAYFDNAACNGTVSSTAYFRQADKQSTLLYLSTSPDGKTVVNQLRNTLVVTPAGSFRVLVVLVGYADTMNQSNASLFVPAQGSDQSGPRGVRRVEGVQRADCVVSKYERRD